jgi:hypothetical protein
VPTDLLERARRPPKSVEDLQVTLSLTSSALLSGQITRGEADAILDITKFQLRLLERGDGEEREMLTQLARMAGLSAEEAATMPESELMERAQGAMGGGDPMAPPS